MVLYPHQKAGVDAILAGFNAVFISSDCRQTHGKAFLLADEMGLGKTIQALTAVSRNLTDKPTLVVCPASVAAVWTGPDYANYFADVFPDLRDIKHLSDLTSKSLVVCSYAMLVRTPLDQEWGHVILDEVHSIKNPKSAKCKAVAKLKAEFRLGLTGTPVMNSGNDMVTIMKFGLGMEKVDWNRVRGSPNGPYCCVLLERFTLRRTKNDVDLDQRQSNDEIVVLSWDNYEAGVEAYRVVKEQAMHDKSWKMFFKRMQRLRQLCLHADGKPSPKMRKLMEIWEAHNRERLVVMSAYRSFLVNVLSPWLKDQGVRVAIFRGGPRSAQQRALRLFKDVDMLLVVKQAGAVGLNLQKSSACVVIMDPHFNASLDDQAAHRVDRIGQEKKVCVYRLFMAHSIDTAMLEMQKVKKEQAEAWTRKKSGKSYDLFKLHLTKYDTV